MWPHHRNIVGRSLRRRVELEKRPCQTLNRYVIELFHLTRRLDIFELSQRLMQLTYITRHATTRRLIPLDLTQTSVHRKNHCDLLRFYLQFQAFSYVHALAHLSIILCKVIMIIGSGFNFVPSKINYWNYHDF